MAEEIRWRHQAQEERDAVLREARNGALLAGSRVRDTLLWQEEEIRRLKNTVPMGDLYRHEDLVSSYTKEIELSMAGDFVLEVPAVPEGFRFTFWPTHG